MASQWGEGGGVGNGKGSWGVVRILSGGGIWGVGGQLGVPVRCSVVVRWSPGWGGGGLFECDLGSWRVPWGVKGWGWG